MTRRLIAYLATGIGTLCLSAATIFDARRQAYQFGT
jgi:hypothetical protein